MAPKLRLPWPFGRSRDRGKARDAAEELDVSISDLEESYNAYIDWFVEEALPIYVSFMVADIAGELKHSGTVLALWDRVNELWDQFLEDTEDLREQLGTTADDLEELYQSVEVQAAVDFAKAAHVIGLEFSPAYRAQVAELYTATSTLSMRVFGSADTLNSGLTLLQMLTYDVSSLEGEPVDLAEGKFFNSMLEVTEGVADQSQAYGRNPGLFWADLNNRYLAPLQSDKTAQQSRAAARLAAIGVGLASASEKATAANDRIIAYQEELEPFLSKEKLDEIEDIRLDFQRRVRDPLNNLDDFFTDEWPPKEEQITENEEAIETVSTDLAAVEELFDPSPDQDPVAAAHRDAVWQSILDDTLDTPDTAKSLGGSLRRRVEEAILRL